jgi:hypothetical protein
MNHTALEARLRLKGRDLLNAPIGEPFSPETIPRNVNRYRLTFRASGKSESHAKTDVKLD